MKNILILLMALVIAISSCKTNHKNDRPFIEFGKIPAQLVDSLKSGEAEMQQQEIDPTKDNVIKGKNGVVIFIYAGSLLDEHQKPLVTEVIVELKECYDMESLLLSSLQTAHTDGLLQTQGMIYVSARTLDGFEVQIDKAKPVRVEIPVRELVRQTQIFKGERRDDGSLNWGDKAEPSKDLVPFPIKTMHGGEWKIHSEFRITQDPVALENIPRIRNQFIEDDINKYENTFIGTREFEDRYFGGYANKAITQLYIDNLEKKMWEIDEMTVQLLMKDSTYASRHPKYKGYRQYSTYMDSIWLKCDDEKYLANRHNTIEQFRRFAAQRLTRIDQSKKMDDSISSYLFRARLRTMNDRNYFVTYDARQFGWVNVGTFYDDPKAENMQLLAKTNEEAYIVSLIIPSRQIIISGIPKEDHTYCFTHSEDGYAKLPKGEKAFLVTIGIKENQLHFAQKEIVLGQNVMEPMDLKAATAEEIKKELKKLG